MPADAVTAEVARAERHAHLRWVGIVLFCIATPVLVGGVAAWLTGRAPGKLVPLCLFALGLSLGSFGTNDDSALHAYASLARKGALPASRAPELDAERKVRAARLSTLHAHPKASVILPIGALLVVGLAAWRVATAWAP